MERKQIQDHIQRIKRGDRERFTDRFTLKVDKSTARRETLPDTAGRFPGQDIVVFDAVPTREGVMNYGLKMWDELVKAAPTLDMAWVTKDHPSDGWVYSADEGIGFCRNTTCDEKNKRLKTQLCIFDNEANEKWILAVEMGIKDENSVGFTCKMTTPPELEEVSEIDWIDAMLSGEYENLLPSWEDEEFGPRAYDHIQSDIFFNHDAILDAGDGACGSDYGCEVGAAAGDTKEEKMIDEQIKKQLSDCREAQENSDKRHAELADAVQQILKFMEANMGDSTEEEEEPEEETEEEEEPEESETPEETPDEPDDEEEEDEDEEEDDAEPEGDASETETVEVRLPGADTRPKETTKTPGADRLKHMGVGGRQPDGSYPGEKRYTKE